ncbi:unnamed protein product [Ixodes persulcatus]
MDPAAMFKENRSVSSPAGKCNIDFGACALFINVR